MDAMNLWKDGAMLQAAVLGFLPGKRVLLDINGDTYIAWSNLPLVRGKIISVVVDCGGGATRLRIVGEESFQPLQRTGAGSSSHLLPGSSEGPDDLDRLVALSARTVGVKLDDHLRNVIREEALAIVRQFPGGVVPFDQWKREIDAIVIARGKGIVPSRRARHAIELDHEAQIGTLLARLIESMREVDPGGSPRRNPVIERWTERLRAHFIPLDQPGLAERLGKAIANCGYNYEARLVESGLRNWPDNDEPPAADLPRELAEDLKGSLLELRSYLFRLADLKVGNRNEQSLRSRERAAAWCGRLLDTIESLQVHNLGETGRGAALEAFQIPIKVAERAGTLSLILSAEKKQFWVDLRGMGTVGGELTASEEGGLHLTLFLPPQLADASEPVRQLLEAKGYPVKVCLIRSPMIVTLDEALTVRKKVNLVL